jgi:hypothetical protein
MSITFAVRIYESQEPHRNDGDILPPSASQKAKGYGNH